MRLQIGPSRLGLIACRLRVLHKLSLPQASDTNPKNFRGINSGGTMGPMDLERGGSGKGAFAFASLRLLLLDRLGVRE